MSEEKTIYSPDHYTAGGIETIDYMRAKMSQEEFKGYCKGNILKYMSRSGLKGKELEDLKKARLYLDWLIEALEKK